MTDTFGSEVDARPPDALRRRRSFGMLGLIAVLVLVGVAAGFVWLNLDAVTDALHGAASPGNGSAANSDVLASASEPSVSAADFAAFQQQNGSAIQSVTAQVSAQQAELKRLSDQIQALTSQLAILTVRVDQAQQGRPTAASQPAAAAPAATASTTATAPRPAPTAPRKRPPAARPAGAISVGGAPLPASQPR